MYLLTGKLKDGVTSKIINISKLNPRIEKKMYFDVFIQIIIKSHVHLICTPI